MARGTRLIAGGFSVCLVAAALAACGGGDDSVMPDALGSDAARIDAAAVDASLPDAAVSDAGVADAQRADGCVDVGGCALPPGVTVDQWGNATSDVAWGVAAGPSGQAVVVGETGASLDGQPFVAQTDLFVASRRVDAAANWTRMRGTMYSDSARAVVAAPGGGVYVAGWAQGALAEGEPSDENPFVSRYSAAGQHLWTSRWGSATSDAGYGLHRDANGNLYVSGFTRGDMNGANKGGLDAFVTKLGASGDELWSAQFGTKEDEIAMAVTVDAAGNVYTVGQTFGAIDGKFARGRDAFLAKHDAEGNPQWVRQWGSGAADAARAVMVANDGTIVVTGFANASLGRSGNGPVFLGKWDADGTELWIEQWGASGSVGRALAVDGDGAILVVGRSGGDMDGVQNAGGTDVFVSRWTHAGITRSRAWSRLYGTDEDENAYAVSVAPDGALYVVGNTAGTFPGFTNGGQMLHDSFLLRIVLEPDS